MHRTRVATVAVAIVALLAAVWSATAIVQRMTAQPPMEPMPTGTVVSTPVPDDSASSRPALGERNRGVPSDEPTSSRDAASYVVPTGRLQQLVVRCGDDAPLVSAKVQSSTTPAGQTWRPPSGVAEWWSADGWPVPGTASKYAGVIGGHVRYGGAPDVFGNLSQASIGCLVDLHYDSGDTTVFKVASNPESIDKSLFATAPKYDQYWEPRQPGSWLTLVTCDAESDVRADGFLSGNIALRAVRIQ